jgi:hypothetical protein
VPTAPPLPLVPPVPGAPPGAQWVFTPQWLVPPPLLLVVAPPDAACCVPLLQATTKAIPRLRPKRWFTTPAYHWG